MHAVAPQYSEGHRPSAGGDHVLVVTAGRVDRCAASAALALFERIGVTCTVLDVSSPGGTRAFATASVRTAFEELAGGSPASARTGIAAAGSGAGPALAAAAELTGHASLPGVLIVDGRFDAAWRPFAALGTRSLLLRDGGAAWRERRTLRQVRRELADGGEIVILETLARGAAVALDTWCCVPAAQPTQTAGRSRRSAVAGVAGLALTLAPAVVAAPAAAGQFSGGKTVAASAIAGDGFTAAAVDRRADAAAAGSTAAEGKKVPRRSIQGDGLGTRATGSGVLIGGGFRFDVNTNITFSTSSSASAAMSEASATAALNASTANGGTASAALSDAFDGYNALAVHVGSGAPAGPAQTGNPAYVFYNKNGAAPTTDCAGRQFIFPDQVSGDLTMSRRVWVSPTDAVARWLNVFTNTSGAPIDVTMYTSNNLGSDSNTRIFATSSGDTVATTADSWIGTFQNYSGLTSSDPRIGHVLRGASVANGVASVNFADGDDNPFWTYTRTLGPGQTTIIADYVVLAESKPLAAQRSAAIAASPPLDCTTAVERAQVANFDAVAPVITPPTPPSVVTSSASGTPVSFSTTATDAVDGAVPVICTPPSGSTFPVGVTTVSCQASDGAGNTAMTTFAVTVTLSGATPPPPAAAYPLAPFLPPRSTVRRPTSLRQPITLRGTATGTNLRVVRVSVGRHVGTDCRFLRADRTFSAARDCRRMIYVSTRGTATWRYKLPRLRAGRYMVWSRAINTAGSVERKARTRNLTRFTIRAR